MKKIVSLGLCCLLCTMHLTANDAHAQNLTESRDAKTNNILSSVVKVVEGIINIIKIIKDSRHDKLTIKVQAESELAQAVSNIKHIATISLPLEELSNEDIKELCAILHDAATNIQPLLREYIKEDITSVHDYLQSAPLQELQQQLQVLNEMEAQDLAIAATDEHEKEFHAHIIQALHNLVQNLFSIIQAPENPKVIGQNIADMLSNIINVASQTLKYEYLSSRDAEENVAVYLESFSNELTKEIKHLMLQTALHLRGCKQTRKCNNSCSNGCNSCGSCSTICRPCCNACSTCSLNMLEENTAVRKSSCCSSCGCSPKCSTTCSSCNNSCCSLRAHSNNEESVTRACPNGCSKCCCSYGTRKETTPKEMLRKAIIRNNKRRACTTCNSCGKNCNTCGCKKKITEVQQEAEAARCGCGAKPKPKPNRTDAQNTDDTTKCGCGKPKPQQPTIKSESAQSAPETKCGCGNPKPKPNVARHNAKSLIFPENYKG